MTGESHLLYKAQRGDPEALDEILNRYKDQSFSLALGIVQSEFDAEDIVQNAFIKVFKHLRQFKNESKFSTWLYRIVYNESIRLIKQEHVAARKEVALDDVDVNYYSIDNALRPLFADERRRIIKQALQKLSYNENTILTLFYLEEKSIRELQRITGFSKSNIKVILHRARKKLYQTLSTMLNQEVTSIL
ncbi:sigma-70 family RNA polymerase sigma factor [candidate division KSB1 bacterium]|nr:sigma-70 family RNA polymerase sigma factor [candidate division KSB1 bacterium]